MVGRRRRDHVGDAGVVLGAGADVEVGAERAGHLVGEERAERSARHALDDLAQQVALADGVIAGLRTGLPPRGLRGVQRDELVVVEQVLLGERLIPARQPGGVAQHVARGHRLLAGGGELGPVRGDRLVQVELTSVGEDQAAQRGHRLGGRPHVDDGVRLPRPLAVVVGRRAAPQVDDQLAVDGQRHRRPDVALGLEVRLERVPHRLETRRDRSVDLRSPHRRDGSRRSPPDRQSDYHRAAAVRGIGAGTGDGAGGRDDVMVDKWLVETDLSEEWDFYTRANVGEVFPDPVSPLSFFYFQHGSAGDRVLGGAEMGFRNAYYRIGVMEPDELPDDQCVFLGVTGGYAYLNASALRMLGHRAPGMTAKDIDDSFFGDAPGVPEFVVKPGFDRPDLTAKIGETFGWVLTTPNLPDVLAHERLVDGLRASRPELSAMTDRELVDYSLGHRRRALRDVVRRAHLRVVPGDPADRDHHRRVQRGGSADCGVAAARRLG